MVTALKIAKDAATASRAAEHSLRAAAEAEGAADAQLQVLFGPCCLDKQPTTVSGLEPLRLFMKISRTLKAYELLLWAYSAAGGLYPIVLST